MRTGFVLAVAVSLALGPVNPIRSQEAASLTAIVEKAIEAQGGAKALAKLTAMRAKAKGTLFLGGMELPVKLELYQQLPGQLKTVMTLQVKGAEETVIEAVSGEVGWHKTGGKPAKKVDEQTLRDMKDAGYVASLSTLTPLLKDKSLKLSALEEVRVDGKPAVGIKVESKDRPDVRLYFDKGSGLLVKLTRPALDPLTKQAVRQEDYLGEYRAVDGLRHPHQLRVFQNGRVLLEAEIQEIVFVPSLDEKTFTAP